MEEQEQQQYATNSYYSLPSEFHHEHNNKIEFHDPWEDYYRRQEANAETQNNTATVDGNESQEHKYKFEFVEGKEDELIQRHCYAAIANATATADDCHISGTKSADSVEKRNEARDESAASVSSCRCDVIANTSSDDSENDNIERQMTQILQVIQSDNPIDDQSSAIDIPNKNSESHKEQDINNIFPVHNVVCEEIQSLADKEVEQEAGLAGALSHLRLGEPRSPEQDAYEQLMRRQCWESGQVDYSGRDSFDNIWKKISQTLDTKPDSAEKTEFLTSADIEDGKIEYDSKTGASTQYRLIEGGYEMVTTTPQPNGTVKTSTRTFWDPKPVSEEDLKKEQANKKLIRSRLNKEIRIDERTTMVTRLIEGGYEEVYTTINEDGTRSSKTKTFFDSVPEGTPFPGQDQQPNKQQPGSKKTITRKTSVESNDSVDNRKVVQQVNKNKNQQLQSVQQTSNIQQQSTYQETRRSSQNIEITENNRTVRQNSLKTEQNIKQVTSSNVTDGKEATTKTKKTKKPKNAAPPPPADFVQNETTTITTKRVPGGHEYTYSTVLESGQTITTSKTVYEEEESELTEEEIKQYKKTIKDAEKHKNLTTTKKLKSQSGTKKVVPSENPGDVTTVETIKIDGGTEYHYTTVTAEGIVKKAVKTIYDPVACSNPDDTEEEEIVEEYEEEIIEPGEKNVRTIESIKTLPKKFEEEVTITTHEKKEKKTSKRSMVISH